MTDTDAKLSVHCQWCGKKETLHWNPECERFLLEARLCFNCGFWLEKMMWAATDRTADGRRVARINHNHYVINADEPGRHGLGVGMGGRKMVIELHDGTEATSHNLWHQGEIPERFRDRLPDNARWGREKVRLPKDDR